ncbi:MAG: PIG-L family deacetylase [Lachnospiraceae bacterium]|nr:PIG-L family deacetylase [Lachnospiraceae bacterium]
MLRKLGGCLMLLCICVLFMNTTVYAAEADYLKTTLEAEGFARPERLTDGDTDTYSKTTDGGQITLSREDGISAIYIEFDRIPEQWTLTDPDTGEHVTCGTQGYLHEYVDVEALLGETDRLQLQFPAGTVIADIYGFSAGEVPGWVQRWEPVCEEADLLLISSHSDDEQLFFAGMLPYYAIERGLEVQVAYVVQHFEVNGRANHVRHHEQLDGLWAVGVTHYPLMSDFPDLYAESKDRDTAFAQASKVYEAQGITYDDFIAYITKCLRRCKPLVVVSHDLDGEYGHGTHVLCAAALTEAIEYAADAAYDPESADTYGTWRVEKTYLHLYEENPILMDWDTPLESLGGKTPFQVTREGFDCHKSQHWTWFYKWIYGTDSRPIHKAADIRSYSPCKFGLYDSQVGADVAGGDFFEHVPSYAQRAIAAAEAEAAAKAAAEEAAREQERLERIAAEQRMVAESCRMMMALVDARCAGSRK